MPKLSFSADIPSFMPFFVLNLRFVFMMILQYSWEYFDWNDYVIPIQNFSFDITKHNYLDKGKVEYTIENMGINQKRLASTASAGSKI